MGKVIGFSVGNVLGLTPNTTCTTRVVSIMNITSSMAKIRRVRGLPLGRHGLGSPLMRAKPHGTLRAGRPILRLTFS